jgi:PAS domain S-box-containing protein
MPDLLAQLLAATPDAFAVADLAQTKFVYANRAFEQLWQVSSPFLADHPASFFQAVHPEDQPKAEQFLAAMYHREVAVAELRLRGIGPATRCWVELRALALPASEQFVGLQAQDITLLKEQAQQHRQALEQVMGLYEDLSNHQEELKASLEEVRLRNQQLAQSRGEIASIIQNASEAICSLDSTGKLLSVNHAGLRLFGLREEKFVYQYLVNLVAKDYRKDVAGFLMGYSHSPTTEQPMFRMELAMRRANREEFPAQLSISRIEGLAGAGFVAIVTDLSDIHKREEELLRARAAAEQAAAAKSQFLSNMSHEIRTPLNAIVGLAHLLREEATVPEQRRKLETIQFSADNLLALINDVLDFSKIEAGNLRAEAEPFDLQQLLANLLAMFAQRAQEKGLALVADLAPDLPTWVVGDKYHLSQILTNLLGNAVKFTERGQVALRAWARTSEQGRVGLSFRVEDTGIGIAADKQQLIFERFTQAGDEIGRQYGGTGLGLAIVKKLVELHGGQILVESAPGQGAAFECWLDFLLGQPPAQATPPASSPEWLARQTILVAEDNPINQLVVAQWLQKWGATVRQAHHGREALEILENEKIDLLLLDLNMPGLGGFELAQALAQSGSAQARQVPIVVLTADVSPQVADKVRLVGLAGLVTKPFQPADLQEVLAKVLGLAPVAPPQSLAAAVPPAQAPLLQLDFLADGGQPGFAHEFIELNLQALGELPARFAQVLDAGDLAAYRTMRHHLTSNLVLLRFDQLKNALLQAEKLMGQGAVAEKEQAVAVVRELCGRAIEVLENYLANLRPLPS